MIAVKAGQSVKPAPADEVRDFTTEELALSPFDAAEFLDSEESISAYLAALLEEGNPEFGTILKVMRALGLKLITQPARTDPEDGVDA